MDLSARQLSFVPSLGAVSCSQQRYLRLHRLDGTRFSAVRCQSLGMSHLNFWIEAPSFAIWSWIDVVLKEVLQRPGLEKKRMKGRIAAALRVKAHLGRPNMKFVMIFSLEEWRLVLPNTFQYFLNTIPHLFLLLPGRWAPYGRPLPHLEG